MFSSNASSDAADVEAIFAHVAAGRPIDPALAERVRKRSEQIREGVRRMHGDLNVAVDLIREIRDEE